MLNTYAYSKKCCLLNEKGFKTLFTSSNSHANEAHADLIVESWELCSTCHSRVPNLSKHTCNVAKSKSRLKSENGPEKFFCEFCPESFGQETDLVLHCNRVHFDDICGVWVKCEKCLEYLPSEQVSKILVQKTITVKF